MTAAAMTAIFALAMVTAMITDLTSMTIRNRVSIGLTLGFVLLAPFCGISLADYGWHLAVGGIVLIITFSLFCLRAMGGGDAKLIAATALWFGPNASLMDYIVMVSILGGVLTLTIILYRMIPVRFWRIAMPSWERSPARMWAFPTALHLALPVSGHFHCRQSGKR